MSDVNVIVCGDCKDVLSGYPDNSIDLVVTSPPYANSRKKVYGGIDPDDYVEWFLPISEQLLRTLKPTGTFILNMKEKVVKGERHTYVLELILAMKRQGWFWTEEFIWHKKNSYPGKWPNRFRDSWERLLQFNKTKTFKMFQEEVMVPRGGWAKKRLSKLNDVDLVRDESATQSGMGKKIVNWVERENAYPTNVLHMATECANRKHSAVFPMALPVWFIRLFSEQGDVVLDPFVGSGTTVIAAKQLGRNYIGIDVHEDYCKIAKESLGCMII